MIPEYVTKRTRICRNCSICDQINEICRADMYVNPDTNECSMEPKEGFKKGCGCHLQYKINNIKNKCPAGKW